MSDPLDGRFKIGVTRAIRGMMSVADQNQKLLDFGVDEDAIWRLGKFSISDIGNAVRRGNDVLVVPFLGVLGKDRFRLLVEVAQKGGSLFDLNNMVEHDISQAPTFNEINEAVRNANTAPARTGAAESKNKSGPKPKLTGDALKQAKAAWESTEGSNEDVADDHGVSSVWMFRKFGSRSDAQKRARKRIATK